MKPFLLFLALGGGLIFLGLSLLLSLLRLQSPRSHEIVYVDFGPQEVGIYRLYLGHRPQLLLGESQSSYVSPRWSPDGRTLFYSRASASHLELYRMARGSYQAQTLPYFFYSGWGANWSPDGSQIVFTSRIEQGNNLYRMNLDGSQLEALTETRDSNFDPAWFGDWVVFVSLRDSDLELYLLNLKTKALSRLTNRPGDDIFPSWSPDGAWILYSAKVGGQLDLYKIRPDGRENQALTQTPGQDEYYAAWSPDGQRIIFASSADYSASPPNWDLEMILADGTGRQVVLADPQKSEVMPSWLPIIESPWRGGGMMLLGGLLCLGAISRLVA